MELEEPYVKLETETLNDIPLPMEIKERLMDLITTGKLNAKRVHADILETLQECPPDVACKALDRFNEMDTTLFSDSLLKVLIECYVYDKVERSEGEDAYGPRSFLMKNILKRTGYPLSVSSTERKYGPRIDWQEEIPDEFCVVICENIPATAFEDELILLFENYGKIFELTVKMDPVTDHHLGWAEIKLSSREEAWKAKKGLDGYELRSGAGLKINMKIPLDNEIIIKNIPRNLNRFDILRTVGRLTKNLLRIVLYHATSNGERPKNLGLCVLIFDSFNSAVKAYRVLCSTTVGFFNGNNVTIEWAQYRSTDHPNGVHSCIKSDEFQLCSCVENMLDEIDEKCAELSDLQKSCDEKNQKAAMEVKNKNLLQYAYHSCALEYINTEAADIDHIVEATKYALQLNGEIRLKDIIDIQKLLKVDVDIGLRTCDSYGVRDSYGIWSKLPEAEKLQQYMSVFLSMLNRQFEAETDNIKRADNYIIRAAFVSLFFVIIHPLRDGNGRLSRILFHLILKKCGSALPFVIFSSSKRDRYHESIREAGRTGNYTLHYRFICRSILATLEMQKAMLAAVTE